MSIPYKFVPIYDNLNKEDEKVTGFYPKVVSRDTIHKYNREVTGRLRCLPGRFMHFRRLGQLPPCGP